MSDWADAILAGSNLPEDDFTFTEASTFGLDSFEFDEEENEGVLDGARLPETKGLAELPGDIMIAAEDDWDEDDIVFDEVDEDGLNLGDYVDETAIERTASLSDLGWLDPTSPQNPDRLPENPVDKGVLKLEEAWGFDRRTDGINLVPNKDKEILDYERSLVEGPESGLPTGSQRREAVKTAIQWAFRQAAEGKPVREIKKALVARLGNDAKHTRGTVQKLQSDEGLAGNVFLYSVMYPEIHKGRTAADMKEHLRKKRARYVVVPPGEKKLSVWRAIGKEPVEKVPWKRALAHYGPKLEATGYKVASEGKPRDVLRQAFRLGPQEPEVSPSVLPKDVRPSERVGVQEAVQQFRTAEAVPRQAIDVTTRQEEAERKKVLVQIAKWVKAGHITKKDAHRLARSPVSPKLVLRTATMLVQAGAAAPTGSYKGEGTHYKTKTAKVSKDAAWAKLRAAEAEMDRKARDLDVDRKMRLGIELKKLVQRGVITVKEAAKLAALDKPVDEILRIAGLAAQTDRDPEMKAAEEREYEGPILEAAQASRPEKKAIDPYEKKIRAASKRSGIKVKEIRSLLKWARIQMSEGTAGDELTQLMKLRFSKPLIKAARNLLGELRTSHEGLSGHVYVDAGAYVSAKGTKGCERGARTHRTGGLKAVLAIPRCETCTRKNADEICTLYNKPLVDEAPVQNPGEYQAAAIRAANASDAEVTAGLFANNYDEGEYALVDPLQEISLHEAAAPEELGEILWGDGVEL